jgi:hypothetical protein
MDTGRDFRGYFRNFVQLLAGLGRKAARVMLELFKSYLQERHPLTQIVVQLSGNARALLLLRLNQPAAHARKGLFRQLTLSYVRDYAYDSQRPALTVEEGAPACL